MKWKIEWNIEFLPNYLKYFIVCSLLSLYYICGNIWKYCSNSFYLFDERSMKITKFQDSQNRSKHGTRDRNRF